MHSLAANTKLRYTMKQDLSNVLAAEMHRILNSDENKQIFSTSSMIEKQAFKKVSEEDAVSEIEKELDTSLNKKASAEPKTERNLVKESVESLLKISEDLDTAGFEKLAAASILLADKLVVEAKKSKKSDKKSKEDKSKGKKVDMKERMKKMREMKKSKKDDNKSSKSESNKSSKKSEAQVHNELPPQKIEPKDTEKQEGDLILKSLHPSVRAAVVILEVHPSETPGVHNVLVRVHPGNEAAFNVIKNTISALQSANKLPAKSYVVQQA